MIRACSLSLLLLNILLFQELTSIIRQQNILKCLKSVCSLYADDILVIWETQGHLGENLELNNQVATYKIHIQNQ